MGPICYPSLYNLIHTITRIENCSRAVKQGLLQYVPGGQMLPVSPSVGVASVAPPTQ